MKKNHYGVYKASNVTFNHETMQAFSYDWWKFVDRIKGKVVFNSFNYSPSTIKHQYKIRALLRELGIGIDHEIECPRGLQDLSSGGCLYSARIEKLSHELARPRTQAKKNAERLEEIKMCELKINLIRKLMKS